MRAAPPVYPSCEGGPVVSSKERSGEGVTIHKQPDHPDHRLVENEKAGRNAVSPSQFPLAGWKDIFWRVWSEVNDDRVMLVAGGVTFYMLLALFPALAAFVSFYGFVADPVTIAEHLGHLAGLLPEAGLDLIEAQLNSLATQGERTLGTSFLIGLAIAMWSANNGIKAIFDAMNIAYEETEGRGFLMLNLWSGLFTLAALIMGVVLLTAIAAVPAMLAFLRLDAWSETLLALGRWPLLIVVVWTGVTLIYRFGPSRRPAKWRWLNWGAAFTTLIWIAASWGFSFYLQNFADYNATYGSLGAVIGLMMWTWISVIILIVGAEINAEMEHQTAMDSTVGTPRPLGERGAVVADTLGDRFPD